ncbi:DsbA family protein [Candidatus Micrarchaeota archaeon]|nr:DsbA family protein [Candidatus Micrarchaeota archaeon]
MDNATLQTVFVITAAVVFASLAFSTYSLSGRMTALERSVAGLQAQGNVTADAVNKIYGQVSGLQGGSPASQNEAPKPVNEAGATQAGVQVDLSGKQPRGNASARVSIIEFSDFECPFCGVVYPTIQKLLAEYNRTLNLYYMHLPLHQHSQKAAEAYECALVQGGGWEMHDRLFRERMEANDNNSEVNFTNGNFKLFAEQVGLDADKFNSCLDSGTTVLLVQKDYGQATKLFSRIGTPTFVINCNEYGGAMPYETFKKVIEYELNHTATCA